MIYTTCWKTSGPNVIKQQQCWRMTGTPVFYLLNYRYPLLLLIHNFHFYFPNSFTTHFIYLIPLLPFFISYYLGCLVHCLLSLLLYQLIQFNRSQVTGPLDLTKCHTCPRSQRPLTKPPSETQKKTQKYIYFAKKFRQIFDTSSKKF